MLLEGLSHYNRPLEIKFDEMLKLMDQCEHVDKLSYASRHKSKLEGGERSNGGSASATTGGATMVWPLSWPPISFRAVPSPC